MGTLVFLSLLFSICNLGLAIFFLYLWSKGNANGWSCVVLFFISYTFIVLFGVGMEKLEKPEVQYYECKIVYTKQGDEYVKDSFFVKINNKDLDIKE